MKASSFYLFGLTDSEAAAQKRALDLLLTPQELLHLKLKDTSLSSQIFQLFKTSHSKVYPSVPAAAVVRF